MEMSDKDRFLEVMKGVPAGFIASAMNLHRTGSDWRGCSKSMIFEGLFGSSSHALSKLPSLEKIKEQALEIQESSKKATAYNRKCNEEWHKEFVRAPQRKKEIIDTLNNLIGVADAECPETEAFIKKAKELIKELKGEEQ